MLPQVGGEAPEITTEHEGCGHSRSQTDDDVAHSEEKVGPTAARPLTASSLTLCILERFLMGRDPGTVPFIVLVIVVTVLFIVLAVVVTVLAVVATVLGKLLHCPRPFIPPEVGRQTLHTLVVNGIHRHELETTTFQVVPSPGSMTPTDNIGPRSRDSLFSYIASDVEAELIRRLAITRLNRWLVEQHNKEVH